jgi:serine/threonine-protein kinase
MLGAETLPWSTSVDYSPGELVAGKYRLLRFLGEGSQGSVWQAENLALHSDVAIKLVRGGPHSTMPTLRLEKEARLAAQIPHPAAVRVFDLGWTSSGDTFIVMELLEGESLGARLTTCGRLSPVEAVRTLLPIADVLFAAHQRDIVHRDLKPENIFLAKNGATIQPKLLDFGIAKRHHQSEHAESVITDVGALVGSPAYSSPEQIECRKDVGQAADIWSFCVVLYECLTGALPFESETCRELFRQIESEPPVSTLAHGAGDVALWKILERGLSKDPAARWPDMQALGRALASWLWARGVEDDISAIRLDARWVPKARTEAFAPGAAAPPPSNRLPDDDPEGAVGVRPTVVAPTLRRRVHWLALGVAAAAPLVFGYGAATSRAPAPAEQRKPQAPVVIELPPQLVTPAKVEKVEKAPPPAAANVSRPPASSPKPASSGAVENKPISRRRKPLDLMNPY